ncbi:natriuretic peptides B isoform X1 [Octodon degus]|uniref:Natriuretic peptides B n=1 Tax=Octodon degus TaxID=10160 RepID=A0A6P6D5D2_OCTDE|nr:natriuretic peptides B isoform X1 [Octodon degus]
MGPQTALPQTILLLLLLHLLSEGGQSHPLGRPDQASAQLGLQVSETQAEYVTLEPHQQGSVPTEAWNAGKTAPKSTLQVFRGVQMAKEKQGSSCFGKTRMDRIDSVSGLGCKVLRWP